MDKPVKRLPNGVPSSLSMNSFLITGIDKEDPLSEWNGKHGADVYSGSKINDLLANISLGCSSDSQNRINSLLQLESSVAQRIRLYLSHIAGGLSSIFYLLNTNQSICRQSNCLNEHDWEFWSTAKEVFLVGHLVEGQAGTYIESEINRHLMRLGVQTLRVSHLESIITPSLIGCASIAYPSNPVFVFDFGASTAKSGFAFRTTDGYQINEFMPRNTPQLQNIANSKENAHQLHQYILDVILSTAKRHVSQNPARTIFVSMCIANNILNGKIADRGYFAPLKKLGPSYLHYLKDDLEQCLHCPISLSIQNDAEAVTNLFYDYAPYAAVITFGTAMGIAYPQTKEKLNNY